ncbi:hypothetical protein PR202_gb26431 [Eleusine coracana subsp. coracana]|uniref:Uncharacterized protein n=1 Tax=Eleusine coracana subsp. coracana TaxID=191504 RepID=A0AAV5FR64_ELECO|nr:hypothetical protein PR202_gb26431 [Eleusine coracana subsp. coracana]
MQSLCWDNSGKYLATVSPHQVKVWSISSGECIHELTSNGKEFHSCVFHPGYANLFTYWRPSGICGSSMCI